MNDVSLTCVCGRRVLFGNGVGRGVAWCACGIRFDFEIRLNKSGSHLESVILGRSLDEGTVPAPKLACPADMDPKGVPDCPCLKLRFVPLWPIIWILGRISKDRYTPLERCALRFCKVCATGYQNYGPTNLSESKSDLVFPQFYRAYRPTRWWKWILAASGSALPTMRNREP